ncbi:MAG: hypothetical protein RIR97_1925 [Pseudomonadota bacterium]
MRVVVDTNVFVSACIGKGPSSNILELCLAGHLEPVIGHALFSEYRDLLSRTDLFKAARLNNSERRMVFRAFLSRCSWQSVYFGWRPNLLDESDNHVMELAIAANVTIIITNNIRDFRNADLLFPQIRILPPDKFLKEQGHERSDN